MGKLIICNGKQTDKPYFINSIDTRIYSIEELCYYIYNNIDSVTQEFFSQSLAAWMTEELKLPERADKLKKLIQAEAGLKDLVVCVLCSADYYTESEIKQLLRVMDEIAKLSPLERRKKKAEQFLKYRKFTQAATEYDSILSGKEASVLTSEEYGDLIHNLAVVQLNTLGAVIAADNFKDAYERNHNEESLLQYFYALKISRQEDRYQKEVRNYDINEIKRKEIEDYLQQIDQEAEESESYGEVLDLIDYKLKGRISQYYELADEIIGAWKQKFRSENT